ncbi:MAG: alpha/beta hydrolase [Candidatus Taylorbacteria bacterium]|nr:alpha/beta hydrolase [Candidatus Taylorbacteria bacterium]
MGELEKSDIYACALSMPTPAEPLCDEWVEEIGRHVQRNSDANIYLVGHSLGVPAILRYLESMPDSTKLAGTVLVSGPCTQTKNEKLKHFLEKPFDFSSIRSKAGKVAIIHGDNDEVVLVTEAHILCEKLGGELHIVKNGGHLNGSSGWFALPDCLAVLKNWID